MKCLDFRRVLLADPRRLDAEIARHAAQCLACRAFRDRLLGLEAGLADALSVPVPEHLHYRVLRRVRQARRTFVMLACAAGVVGALALGYFVAWERNDPLALAGIDFVVFEEAQTILDAKPPEPNVVSMAAGRLGIALPEPLGEMRYVCTFPFGGGMAYHIVARTAFGKATLMLLPGRPPAARASATARGLTAVVAPTSGGSVTVIGRSPQGVERIVAALTSAS